MSEPVRFGYVGCGYIAQHVHLPNFASLPQCRFMAIAEVRPELGAKIARRYGIPKVYRSHEELAADKDIEAVGVSGPYALQGRIAEDLLKAGKHVFMEKPMAVSIARADAILAATKKTKARLMVGYMKRYDSGNLLLKKHLDAWRSSGEAGRILLARNHGFGGNWVYAQDQNIPFESSKDNPPPAPDECPAWLPGEWKNAYLGYLQQWTHNINLLRFFLDDKDGTAKVVTVQLDKDGMTGLVVFDINGTRAVVESGYTRFHAWEEHTQIYFEGGYLKTDAPPLLQKETPATVEVYRAGSKDGQQPPRLTREFPPPHWSYREEARHFLDNVRSGEPFLSSGEDTAADVRLYEDIYRQFLSK
ncbi:MAG TPA: Gfo/Idh/MocA family oxidoreductase [Planctomycetota bacterium]|nr:Gfo/Idh/MocA family oxidoreductase [Planctomycetota bacterium]